MRNLKRVLSLALALVMVLGMMVITTSAADYTDAEEITYTEAVEVMSALGILKGNPDGTFAPKGTLTREQAAKILAYVCLGADADNYLTGSAAPFDDVAATKWSAKYVAYCKNLGIIAGVGDNKFNPAGTLKVVEFAKMLLVAAGIDGTYTGAGWEENVKTAFNNTAMLKNTGIKVSTAEITREEACELALAAMKVPAQASGWDVLVDGEFAENFASLLDAKLYAADVSAVLSNSTVDVVEAQATGYLLVDNYDVVYYNDYDKAGRPGIRYEYVGADEEIEIDLFYANEALKKFEGPVTQGEIFAAAKVTNKQTTSIDYNIIQDGVDIDDWGNWSAVKVDKDAPNNGAAETAAGTGNGIKSELYKDFDGSYYLVAIREYLGKVTKVNPADEEDPTSKRTIEVTLDKVPTACESKKVFTKATEDFAKDDVVVVTMEGMEIASVALADTVKGVVTKVAGDVYTIGGAEYVKSQVNTAVVPDMDGKEYSWYVDSFGNLIANVAPIDPADPVYNYGILKAADGKAYVEAGTAATLLGKGDEGQEAAEVVQILTAEGKTEIFDTAWKYLYEDADDETKITGVQFVNAAKQVGTDVDEDSYSATISDADTLVKYELDENGKIKSIVAAVANEDATVVNAAGKLTTGKAQITKNAGGTYNAVLTDETVFFLKVDDSNANTTDKYVAYTGYKTVPTITFSSLTGVTDKGEFTVVMIAGVAVEPEAETPETNYIYFADADAHTEWNAEANEGKGAVVYVYENVYLNGEKTTVTFTAEQASAADGAMYAYTVNAKGAMVIDYTDNLLDGTAKVSLVKGDYFKAGTSVYYVDDTTVYYQVAANGALTVAEGIPAVKDYETTILWTAAADAKTDITPVVYFSAAEIEE